MKTIGSLFAIAVFGGSISAHAASFDCRQAKRPVEKSICSNPKLNLADDSLGRVYRASLGRLSSGSVGLLRADQVQWLAWVQQICRAEVASTSSANVAKCLLPLYGARTKQLRTAVVRRDGLSFLTRTQYLAATEEASQPGSPEYPGFGTMQASWPVADSADRQWTTWNGAMEAHAFALAQGEEETKMPTGTAPGWTAKLAEQQDTQVIAQLKSVEQGRVTATLNTETMGHGAAHPSESFETLTWLLQSGRALQPSDVFAAGDGWKQTVAAACWKAISTGEQKTYIYPEVTGPAAEPLQKVIVDTRNWTPEHDGLHISYPEYSVAPRVSPVDDTVIPWLQLKPVLLAGFVAP